MERLLTSESSTSGWLGVDPAAERSPDGVRVLRARIRLARPVEEVFPFFAEAENLERITPPELRFAIASRRPVTVQRGTLIDYRLRLSGIPFSWRTEITEWDPPRSFTDTQLRGPYHTWVHRHVFEPDGDGTIMLDEVRWRLPFWPLGEVALPLVRRRLRRIFDYRAEVIAELFG